MVFVKSSNTIFSIYDPWCITVRICSITLAARLRRRALVLRIEPLARLDLVATITGRGSTADIELRPCSAAARTRHCGGTCVA